MNVLATSDPACLMFNILICVSSPAYLLSCYWLVGGAGIQFNSRSFHNRDDVMTWRFPWPAFAIKDSDEILVHMLVKRPCKLSDALTTE
jgi:hypothetical protein